MEMVGTETETDGMAMEAGAVRMEVERLQMLRIITADLQVLELVTLRHTDVVFFRKI